MTIVDRYLLFLFLKTFLVFFLSFTGLYIVIHLFSNLDELSAISEARGWPNLLYEFYLPRVAVLYDKAAGIFTLVAAIFAISLLQRRREMTAIEAAGITKTRILRPIFLAAFAIIALTIVNRELLIPRMQERLVKTPQNMMNAGQVDVTDQEDTVAGVVLRAEQLFINERRVSEAMVMLPILEGIQVPRLHGKWAILEPANGDHPAGLWLHELQRPQLVSKLRSLKRDNGDTLLFSPADQTWLGPRECFVVCDFSVNQIAYGKQLAEFYSTGQLMADLRKPQRWFSQRQQITVHSRILLPVLDLTLLMLGLPLVVAGIDRNVFVSAGLCFWIVAAVKLTTTASGFLGGSNLIQPASLAAWLPVLIFVPFSVVSISRLNR